MSKKFDVTICGIFVADIIGRPINLKSAVPAGSLTMIDEIKLFTGGLNCNMAIDLAKLGFKAAVMGRLSNDAWKALFTSSFDTFGVDYSAVVNDDKFPAAATMVCVDATGERTFFHSGGNSVGLCPDDILSKIDTIRNSHYFALGYYGCMPALEPELPNVLKELKEKTDTKLLLETAGFVRSTLDDLARSFPYLDFWIPSYEEGKVLTGKDDYKDMVKVFRDRGASQVVGIKLGSEGCYLTEPGAEYLIPSFKVDKVIDTTGAGDSFIAGLFAGLRKGLSLNEAGRFACMVGATAVQALGASSGIKTYEETMKMFEGR